MHTFAYMHLLHTCRNMVSQSHLHTCINTRVDMYQRKDNATLEYYVHAYPYVHQRFVLCSRMKKGVASPPCMQSCTRSGACVSVQEYTNDLEKLAKQ